MKSFKFDIYGIKGVIEYGICSDYTMMGKVIRGRGKSKVATRFSYNIGVDILPVVGGCGTRQERVFVLMLIKDEYEKEVEKMRRSAEFFSFFYSK